MIRYKTLEDDIRRKITDISPNWIQSAVERTAACVAAGEFVGDSWWSDIKAAFMRLQHCKCIFCERQLGSEKLSKIEHDVEHFRPKGPIHTWPEPESNVSYKFQTGGHSDYGYYWLAFDFRNFAMSCKTCNSSLKRSFFPLLGNRAARDADYLSLSSEKPLLCYPIGSSDEDPERLVTFEATLAVPAAKRGDRRKRGEVIIDLFRLNEREELQVERAKNLVTQGHLLDSGRKIDLDLADYYLAPHVPHASCSRAFRRVWNSNQLEGRQIRDKCQEFLLSIKAPLAEPDWAA